MLIRSVLPIHVAGAISFQLHQ